MAAILAETAGKIGWKRYPLQLVAPLAKEFLKRRSPYHGQPGRYAHPWEAVRRKWGPSEASRIPPDAGAAGDDPNSLS